MLFKKYNIYENKLSEQVSDDNPIKQKLINMETPTDKHPIYSFFTIGLLIYIWLFLGAMIYKQAYGYILASVVVVFTTIGIFMTYKKEHIIGLNSQYRRNSIMIIVISLMISIIIPSNNIEKTLINSILSEFVFMTEINNNSYLALLILAFTNLGISLSYVSCPYNLYRASYSENKTLNSDKSIKEIKANYFWASFLGFLVFIFLVHLILNPAEDDFQFKLKKLSMLYFVYFPQIITTYFSINKYFKLYNKCIQYNKKGS